MPSARSPTPIRGKGQAQTVGKQDMLRNQRRSQHSPVGRGGSLKGSQLAGRTIIDEVGLGGGGHQRGALGRKWHGHALDCMVHSTALLHWGGSGGCRLGPVSGL